ncbi:1,4-dihydroxy-2-naphthoate polyprenyltransferase [Sulfuricella sp.]|uniref:1,4-dihydroxy-2-naphthoate polyprenyltransferase n=1 Tax=Sulfuricella sp. TaxID=2099377 RepID=UPI002B55AA69|nr:1,4-dihydroxy-2-naphthoate polyprenyltransferase [Sulfuricella sp.]HUX64150.1 1,4-dihydroxy-2-naphthoate polyprenyltransferase [Sulfuricella sp.]
MNSFHSRILVWLLAARPKTLTVSIVPVMVGSSLAYAETGAVLWLPLLVALAAAMLIQIGTNLHNDVSDFERGADGAERIGPARATASGWLAPVVVRRAAFACFGLAVLLGIYLVWHGGWPILLLGLCSVAAGWAYTGGPRPIAYSALGELFVWLFFGLGAVMGSYYLQILSLGWSVFVAASMVGLLAAAVITVNNYRDFDSDRKIGKNTLAVRIGRGGSQAEYALLLFTPYLLLPLLAHLSHSGWGLGLPLLSLPPAVSLWRRFRHEQPGPVFNLILTQTAQLQLSFGTLLSIGLVL